jgi:RNA polymerase sigma-70 factor (ECF subfamily)
MHETRFGHKEWMLAYAVALRVLKAPDQAEDAAQEALLRAYRFRDRFSGTSRFESWLHRIAFTTALGELRRPHRKRRAWLCGEGDPLDSLPSATDDPEKLARVKRLQDDLTACLAELSDRNRTAFVERFLLGTSERELGKMLGVSTNAAKQRAFRARRAVRKKMLARSPQAA